MSADEQWTCGKGLAAGAVLPRKLGDPMEGMAEMLARHTRALDPHEHAGQSELKAYESLVRRHCDVATALKGLAAEMAGYKDLPMATHDMAVMQDPHGQMEAFRRVIETERELVALLREKVEEGEAMLGENDE